MLKFEYRGLDVMDQIVSVPIAFEEDLCVLHIKDDSYVVWPDFIVGGSYKLSDGFFQMVKVLRGQYLFKAYLQPTEDEWIQQFTFCFYRNLEVLLFKGDKFVQKIPFTSKNYGNFLFYNEMC